MKIDKKHIVTLESVSTHIYVDGGRILFSAQLDEVETIANTKVKTKYVDFHNQFLIDGEIDDEWYDSLSEEDRITFCRYRRIAKAQTKDIRYTNILKTFSPLEILINKIALN